MAHRGRKNADEVLLLAIACGATVENAAAKAGVSTRTATRRMADPAFQKRLRAIRLEMVQRTMGTLTASGQEAARTLLELMKSSTPSVRLGAVRLALEMGIKMREVADLEGRLAALESQAAAEPAG
jgi:hypothetical protein